MSDKYTLFICDQFDLIIGNIHVGSGGLVVFEGKTTLAGFDCWSASGTAFGTCCYVSVIKDTRLWAIVPVEEVPRLPPHLGPGDHFVVDVYVRSHHLVGEPVRRQELKCTCGSANSYHYNAGHSDWCDLQENK